MRRLNLEDSKYLNELRVKAEFRWETKGRRVLYEFPYCFDQYVLFKQREAVARAPAPKPLDLVEAQKRRAIADAEMAELELAHRRKELVSVKAFDRVLGERLDRVRARLTAMPGRLAPDVVGLRSIPEAVPVIDRVVREVMTELSHGDSAR